MPADSEFCFALHHAATGSYVAQIWGWDDTIQRAHHEQTFDPTKTQIITADGRDAGSLSVELRPTEAARRGHPVTLDVLAVNQRAHALYQRLGFHDIARHGENNIKIRMSSARRR